MTSDEMAAIMAAAADLPDAVIPTVAPSKAAKWNAKSQSKTGRRRKTKQQVLGMKGHVYKVSTDSLGRAVYILSATDPKDAIDRAKRMPDAYYRGLKFTARLQPGSDTMFLASFKTRDPNEAKVPESQKELNTEPCPIENCNETMDHHYKGSCIEWMVGCPCV